MRNIVILCVLLIPNGLFSQDYLTRMGDRFILDNGYIIREIIWEEGTIYSSRLLLAGADRNFIHDSREFAFSINGSQIDGSSGWDLVGSEKIADDRKGSGMKLILRGRNDAKGLIVEVYYLLYPQLPVVRKWLRLINEGTGDLNIEAVNVEELQTHLHYVHSVIYHDFCRMKHLGSFTGNWNDPVVVLHQSRECRGMALGNEAPGVLKRIAYHTRHNNFEAGLTHPGQDFPFRKWLAPGEEWVSPKTFVALYEDRDDGFQVIDGEVNDFVRRHMYPQIVRTSEKPVFVYNTWNPFRTFVSDTLVREVARAAAACGIREFIIDDGWAVNDHGITSEMAWGNNYGDWNVDEQKFPGGFKPTFDYIRSLGMKPGIWMSIGSATEDAAVYKEHPEWFVINRDHQPGNLHQQGDDDFHTSCFGTDWVDYIRDVIVSMCRENGLAYTKLDFAIVSSAYVNDPAISGCYATDHPYHRDHQESFIVIYERLLELYDALHRECPDLFIDCTFETAGKLQLMDYAIANHADGNWLSNFEEPSPTGPLKIRQMAWWRSPVLPASSLVIGNAPMDDPQFEFALKSLIGTLPIVLGDPRKIPVEERMRYRAWSRWMEEMQEKYDYMSYRRDLPGFGEPREGAWDGWMRINNDTQEGGIIGVFRHGALERSRQVFVKGLQPGQTYTVKQAPEGTVIHRASGETLMETGFPVEIPELYDGKIFEIGLD